MFPSTSIICVLTLPFSASQRADKLSILLEEFCIPSQIFEVFMSYRRKQHYNSVVCPPLLVQHVRICSCILFLICTWFWSEELVLPAVKIFLSISLTCKMMKVFDSPKDSICEMKRKIWVSASRRNQWGILVTLANNNNKVFHQLGTILTLVFTLSSSFVTYHKKTDVHHFLS